MYDDNEDVGLGSSGYFHKGKELSWEEAAAFKKNDPVTFRAMKKTRDEARLSLKRQQMLDSGASKNQILSETGGLPDTGSGDVSGTSSAEGLATAEIERLRAEKKRQKETLAPEVVPQGRGSGVRSAETQEYMPGKKFGQHLFKLNKLLSNVANNMSASDHPVLQALAGIANEHLDGKVDDETGEWVDGASDHIGAGDSLLKTKVGQSKGQARYIEAARSIAKAHSILSHPIVSEIGDKLGINTEVPSLDDMHKALSSYNVQLPANPHPDINIAGKMYDINSEDARRFAKNAMAEPGTRASIKVRAARSGTRRKYAIDKVSPEELERIKANLPRTDKKATGELPRPTEDTGIAEVSTGNAGPRRGPNRKVKKDANFTAPDNRTRREKIIELVTGKASKELPRDTVRTDANRNVPGIMGKPELGPDIGSNVPPKLPNTRVGRKSTFHDAKDGASGTQNNQGEERL